ncbi:MAG: response regulator [Lewinellaceae bacterium]|nr:response regulator [Lewinellaceae bacterium]
MERRFCIGLWIWMVFSVWGVAQPSATDVLVIDPDDAAYREGRYYFRDQLYIFIDSLPDRSIEEVMTDSFQGYFVKDSFELIGRFRGDMGPAIQFVWARLTLLSQAERAEEWLINISAGEVDYFFPVDSGRFRAVHTGVGVPLKYKLFGDSFGKLPCAPLLIPPGDTLNVYFRLKEVGAQFGNDLLIAFNKTIFKPQVLIAREKVRRFNAGLHMGILVAVAIYHLFIFVYQRQFVTLYFSIFVLALGMIAFEFGGYLEEMLELGRELYWGKFVLTATWLVVYIFHYLFSRNYLRLPTILPWWDRIWMGLLFVNVLSAVPFAYWTFFSGGQDWVDPVSHSKVVAFRYGLGTLIMTFSLVAALVVYLKKHRAAGIYFIAMFSYLVQYLGILVGDHIRIPPWIYSYDGEVTMVLFFALGIASQLRTLQREKLAAEQAELRLKDLDTFKTRFYTNITHQFRTPLTIILGMIDQIQTHPSTWMKKGADMIRRNGQRLLHLVNQILDLSRLEAGQLPVHLVRDDVIQYLKYIVESFHSSAKQRRIELRFLPDTTGLVVDYDPDKLMDILSNLLSNALKFTPEGGRVEVSVGVVTEHKEQLFIRVKDNGPGIPAEALGKVFDRFFQADTGQGSGIGLALTRELVHLLQGEISVKSKEGEGAEFLVALPITRTAAPGQPVGRKAIKEAILPFLHPENDESSVDDSIPVSSQPTLLIVEDSPDVVTYLEAILGPRFHLKVATNGKEGLARARQVIPDLIVSDIMMPEMDGLEMCEALKTDMRTSHIPIILLTAKSDQTSRIEGLRTGADAYLAKPFDKTELLVRIDKLIELRANLQERYRDIRFLFELKNTPADDPHPEDQFMKEVHGIIESHLSDPNFDVPQLCKELGMSRSQCYQKFRALTGQSPADLIRRIRLHKARLLLEATGKNIGEVSAETGFKDLSTFSRSFRREFGVNPREVRKK